MGTKRSHFLRLCIILTLSVLSLPLDGGTNHIGAANVQANPYLSKTGSALDLLVTLTESKVLSGLTAEAGDVVADIIETRSVRISIRFDHELADIEISGLEALGLIFVYVNGKVAHSGTIYGAEIPIDMLNVLEERADVLRIESTWQPGVHDTLDKSAPEINADEIWKMRDEDGDLITGKGIIVANFDTGIDVFHPDFWNADGLSYEWVDTNKNKKFDPGIDVVDLNRNSSADTNETLDFFDAQGPAGNHDGVFQVDMDWLYNDVNMNGQRDYGTAAGFTEADPTYGELIFIADDKNSNNALDVGERLTALKTSKVLKTLNTDGKQRVNGTDLILTDADTNGHGTSVCGIINGGTIGKRKYVGVSPNAKLLVANRYANEYTKYIPWARQNGADVMLYEFGSWTFQFLDGSSNLEKTIDAEAARGIVQVVPAGNLGGSNRHAQNDVNGNGGSTNFTFIVPSTDNSATTSADEDIEWVYITALWRTRGNDLGFTLTTPTPNVANLPAAPGDTDWRIIDTADGHTIWYRRESSSRGTAKYDIAINKNKVKTGDWVLKAINNDQNAEHVDMYVADNQTSWSGGVEWTAFQSEDNIITRPATADSAITVASYSTRGWWAEAGDLSFFSPTGPRIDGKMIMDIAAPGNYDIASARSKDVAGGKMGEYHYFGGTSAAGPHVAAASALFLQWDTTLNHSRIKTMLQRNARKDKYTGDTPNHKWGYGKLYIRAFASQQAHLPSACLLLLLDNP